MWTFEQATGRISNGSFSFEGGWAGQREGKNNPTMEAVSKTGPLPVGAYTIGEPHDSPHTGPYTMDLTPDPSNHMFGRSDFRIHGAAKENPELSSEGCIILPRTVREHIWTSGDMLLSVV